MTAIQLKTQQATSELPARRDIILIIPPRNQQLTKADKYKMTTVFKYWLLMIKPDCYCQNRRKPKKISDIVVSGH